MPEDENKPPAAPPARSPKNRVKGTGQLGPKDKVEARARWVIERWDERPSLRYREMVEEVRKHFEVGKTAGEQAIKRAYALMTEEFSNEHLADRITAKYISLAEAAERDGDWRAARSILDSLRRHLGLGAPDRVEHTIKDENMDDLSDEEVAILAKLDRGLPGSSGGMTH